MEENRVSSISKADSDEKIGEFWDSHDFTEFDTDVPDADFVITPTIPVSIELLTEIEKQAAKRGLKVDELVSLWLQQKLDEEAA
jgi:predicted DNA binding CopG/RHH family protein